MRINQKTLSIVINEIYNKVSLPIIEENNKKLEGVAVDERDEYLKDLKVYNKLSKKIKELENEQCTLKKNYEYKTFNSFKFDYSPFRDNYVKDYTDHLKKSKISFKKYPSKDDIEREIILSGNKDIPALIETVVNKFKL